MPSAALIPRTEMADGPCCDNTLCRFIKNCAIKGACQVVQGLGDAGTG